MKAQLGSLGFDPDTYSHSRVSPPDLSFNRGAPAAHSASEPSVDFSLSFSSYLSPPSPPPPPPPEKDHIPGRLRTMASSSSTADSCLTTVSSSSTTTSPSFTASAKPNGIIKPATPPPSISRSRRLMKHPILQRFSNRTPSSSAVADALDSRDSSLSLLQRSTPLPLPDLPDEALGESISNSLAPLTIGDTLDSGNLTYTSSNLVSPPPVAEFQTHHPDPHDPLEEEYVSVASTSIRQGTHDYPFENGRRYHWFMEGSYNFPNDADEQENEQIRHELVMMLFEDQLHFSPIGDTPQRILDLGTGTGQWAIDMADRYPSALLRGIDLSPIQPNWVPPNVCFMVDDMEGAWMYSQPFDLIHARHAALAVRNWPRVLRNSFMNLKPGGWIELQELDYIPYALNREKDVKNEPVGQYWRLVRDGLSERGVSVHMVASGRLANQLSESGFVNVTERMFHVPIGAWAGDEGLLWRSLFLASVQATALGPLTRGLGWTRQQVEVFLVQVRQSYMDDSLKLGMTMHVVYGQKPT
ncbi:hypothetical protein BROUX41_001801 [Berkeleyomyces rouxiae]|uniref:uncharacterized protein n=1 Tax=Berkeleyomyces rouxiae TaxID=2035830 RepID=UPI003B77FE2B